MEKFSVKKARANLLKIDCVSVVISGITITISLFLLNALRIPDIDAIMKMIFLIGTIIFIKSCYNIKTYFSKSDSLYKYL